LREILVTPALLTSPSPRSARTFRTTTTTSAATAGASSRCGRDPPAFARARRQDARGRQGSGGTRRCRDQEPRSHLGPPEHLRSPLNSVSLGRDEAVRAWSC